MLSDEEYANQVASLNGRLHRLREVGVDDATKLFPGGEIRDDLLFFVSSIERCARLIDGMALMLGSKNLPCATALLRMQVDCCMRVFAAFIAADKEAFFAAYYGKDGKINSVVDDRGTKLQDWYLKERLGEYDKDLPDVYNIASGSVHFSHDSLLMMADESDIPGYDFKLGIGVKPSSRWNQPLIDRDSYSSITWSCC